MVLFEVALNAEVVSHQQAAVCDSEPFRLAGRGAASGDAISAKAAELRFVTPRKKESKSNIFFIVRLVFMLEIRMSFPTQVQSPKRNKGFNEVGATVRILGAGHSQVARHSTAPLLKSSRDFFAFRNANYFWLD